MELELARWQSRSCDGSRGHAMAVELVRWQSSTCDVNDLTGQQGTTLLRGSYPDLRRPLAINRINILTMGRENPHDRRVRKSPPMEYNKNGGGNDHGLLEDSVTLMDFRLRHFHDGH